MAEKKIIYQLFPRLFGNDRLNQVPNGSLEENGCGKFNDIDENTLDKLLEMGISHIWLTGVIRHSTGTAYPDHMLPASHPQILKGLAGSPYAIKDYYDLDPDLAVSVDDRMDEFLSLIDRIHDKGMKVLIDFIPNHVSRDYKSLLKPEGAKDLGQDDDQSSSFSVNNNFYYLPGTSLTLPIPCEEDNYQEAPARVTGNDLFSHAPSINDWYETVKLNYGIEFPGGIKHFEPIPDTWKKMTEILRFWCMKGVDGFRCDMAGMVPVEFWSYAIEKIREEFPGLLFIAEIYEPGRYRDFIEKGGFDYLYDKVGLYDTLRSIIFGYQNTDSISRVWENLEGLDRYMLRFMENHDEQRVASSQFAGDAWKGLPSMAVSTLMNTGPAMIYNGQEVGEKAEGSSGFSGDDGRTSIYDYCSITELQKWRNRGASDGKLLTDEQLSLRESYSYLLRFSRKHPEIQGYFYDLMWQNQHLDPEIKHKVYAFLRYIDNSIVLIVACFDASINKTSIRIPAHAIDLAGMGDKDRFTIQELYPGKAISNLIISQITSNGVPVTFDRSGWTAIRLG